MMKFNLIIKKYTRVLFGQTVWWERRENEREIERRREKGKRI